MEVAHGTEGTPIQFRPIWRDTVTMIRRLAVQHQARVVLNDEARQLVW
jgi:hypothetical protein